MSESKFNDQLLELVDMWLNNNPMYRDRESVVNFESLYFDFHTIAVLQVKIEDGTVLELVAHKSRDLTSLIWTELNVQQKDEGLFLTDLYGPSEYEPPIPIDHAIFDVDVDEHALGILSKEYVEAYVDKYRNLLERDLNDLYSYLNTQNVEERDAEEQSEDDAVRACLVARLKEKLDCDTKVAGNFYDMWTSHSYDSITDLVDVYIEPLLSENQTSIDITRETLPLFYVDVAKASRNTGLDVSTVLTILDFVEQVRSFDTIEKAMIEPLVNMVKAQWPESYSNEKAIEGNGDDAN